MKRSEYDRPRHPIGTGVMISDTWRCQRCGVIRSLQTGWRFDGQGKARKRICHPCYALKYGDGA